MKDPDFPHGETLVTFQPSTMSSLEARAFASSEDPEREIDELSDAAERGSITARIRIGGLLTGLGPKRWREARASWLEALGECEWLLGDYYEPRLMDRAASAGNDQYLLETAAGAVSGMLGELALRLDREEEAVSHLERAVHYQHSESSLRLALLQKSRGRLDLAQFLLASVLEDPAGDADYLLGDLYEAMGMHDLSVTYYRRAAANGHSRAASRIPSGETEGRVDYPRLEETISYGHGWSAEIDQINGGVRILWDDTYVSALEVTSHISGIEVDIFATTHNIYEELEAHQSIVADHRTRTFAVASATSSALIRDNSSTIYTDDDVDVAIIDRRTGSVEVHGFDTVRHAMEYLRLIAPLEPDRVD